MTLKDDGAVVFQARALYDYIYNADVIYQQCGAAGSRVANNSNVNQNVTTKIWDIQLFPNPANNQLTFVSKNESEKLKITIKDINGRIVKEVDLKTMNFIANLELELTNGVYIICFKNVNNETITKKLLIAK